ncbi:MAG: hypothetical protein KAS97_04185 [Candidatus Aminicenantes bacterium]|nr:hypothetical protein [Candidatus Aminicenantes bacterium]
MVNRKKDPSPIDSSFFRLHASSIEINGKALVFLGHSSSGKSTIAQILSKEYDLVSDDKIIVFKNNGEWFIKNGDEQSKLSEYKGNKPIASGSFPVLAFVRIFKSESNEINKIESSLLCKYLIDAVFEVDNQRNNFDIDLRKYWFHLAGDFAKRIQGWDFYFKKETNIINIINKTFEK